MPDILIEEEVSFSIDELLTPMHHIVLYNDDVNTFDHVINCLVKYCAHQPEQAEQCAYLVHHKGRCSIKVGEFKTLTPIYEALTENGLSAVVE